MSDHITTYQVTYAAARIRQLSADYAGGRMTAASHKAQSDIVWAGVDAMGLRDDVLAHLGGHERRAPPASWIADHLDDAAADLERALAIGPVAGLDADGADRLRDALRTVKREAGRMNRKAAR